jgi:metal-sulfur cluster biosynthetic enzyme
MRGPPAKLPLHPHHPERVCWGCDKYCAADALTCGNGSERTQHPAELFGDDWYEWTHPGALELAADLKSAILASLREVTDPNLALITADLGVSYDVTVEEDASVRVRISTTKPGGTLGAQIVGAAERRILAIPGVRTARVDLLTEARKGSERSLPPERRRLAMVR